MRLNSATFFFFQAEDGIRDYKVTGVQTCALPISPEPSSRRRRAERMRAAARRTHEGVKPSISPDAGRKKYTGRATGECANFRVRRWFLMDWIQKIVPVDLTDFAA